MKKPYEEAELEIVRFGSEDVITASQEDDGGSVTGTDQQSAADPPVVTEPETYK